MDKPIQTDFGTKWKPKSMQNSGKTTERRKPQNCRVGYTSGSVSSNLNMHRTLKSVENNLEEFHIYGLWILMLHIPWKSLLMLIMNLHVSKYMYIRLNLDCRLAKWITARQPANATRTQQTIYIYKFQFSRAMAVLTQRDEHVKRKANIMYMLGIEGIYLYNNIYIYALCVSSPVSSSSHFQKYAEKGRHQRKCHHHHHHHQPVCLPGPGVVLVVINLPQW